MNKTIIGVDLGGTRIRAARLDQQSFKIFDRVETLTQADAGPDRVVERIQAEIRKVLPEDRATVTGIGVSSPGPLDPVRGAIINPPNLPGWNYVPLGDALRAEFELPVYVGNDANVAALAEAVLGAARGYRHIIYLTISTGIGSGIIVDGRLLLGRQGFAAEAGHIIMVADGRPAVLEEEASGTGLARRAAHLVRVGLPTRVTEMVNGDPAAVTGKIVGQAAQAGDSAALGIVTQAGRLIGLGIVSLLHLLDPEIIVIGGGVSNLGDLLFDPMREVIQQRVMTPEYYEGLVITTPQLGDDVSIYGAAVLVVTQGGALNIDAVSAKLDAIDNP